MSAAVGVAGRCAIPHVGRRQQALGFLPRPEARTEVDPISGLR